MEGIMKRSIIVVLGLMFCAESAFAQQAHKWYAGVDIGQAELSRSATGEVADFDNKSTSYTLRGGYRFSRFYALEAGYSDLGEWHGSLDPLNHFDISSRGPIINNLIMWPVAKHLELDLILGAIWMDREFSARAGTSGSSGGKMVVPMWGLGMSVPLNDRLAFNFESMQYADFSIGIQAEPNLDLTVEDTTMTSLGVRWRF
jgi:hypothetical protein